MTQVRLPKVFFGITGGIASGKSTVAQRFRDLGVPVIDADMVSREVMAPGSRCLEVLATAFGNEILQPSGELNRRALGDIVFQDKGMLRLLEEIVGPDIRISSFFHAWDFVREGHEVVGFESAVLFEQRIDWCKPVIVVHATEALQLARGQIRDSVPEEKIRARMSFQLPLAEKMAKADILIRNDGNLDTLHARVAEVRENLLALAAKHEGEDLR